MRLEELLEEFGVAHVRKIRGDALSGGERRRVEIARCLATEPRFILLDEPFAGIDPLAIDDIRSIILYLKNQGIGILITDHNVRETLDITDRAYILSGTILRSSRSTSSLTRMFDGHTRERFTCRYAHKFPLSDQYRYN